MKTRIALLALVTAIITSCSPTQYHVEREVVIDAPAALVFEHVNNHKMRDGWSPWEQMDPDMEKSYKGPESGVGAKYLWSGNDSVGTGSLEIVESVPNEYIKSTLTFTSPWESTSTTAWKFEEVEGGVKAVWSVDGELPGYLFWMGEEEMDEMMGKDFQNGLDQLKVLAEEKAAMSTGMPISEVEVEAMPIYYIEGETKISEMSSEFYGSRYGQLMAYLGEDSENMLEMPLAVYNEWDEENDKAVIAVALACESEKGGSGDIKKGMTHAGKAVKCVYTGPYEEGDKPHNAIAEYMKANSLNMAGAPWEVFVTDPGMEPDSTKWVTHVYYPIM
jgi:effector-binding domain-containing protein/uncharacterized protein YndB with AHSA1/START domain